jgi:hypothetical protein
VTAATVVAAPAAREDEEEITAALWEVIEPEFVTLLGWDPEVKILSFPQKHPLLGWKACLVEGCDKIGRSSKQLCAACHNRWQTTSEVPWDEFLASARRHWRSIGAGRCSVNQCSRPWKSARLPLCGTHYAQYGALHLPLTAFLAHPEVVALAAYGRCLVEACTRDRGGTAPYCYAHTYRWRVAQQRGTAPEEDHWRRTTSAVAENNTVSLRGLPPRVVAEVIYGLQERTKQGIKNNLTRLRPLCDMARARQVASLRDLDPAAVPKGYCGLHKSLVQHAVRQGLTPESERHKEIWELSAFGLRGTLRFTEITQPWLREATKRWAFDDLPRHRGNGIRGILQSRINSMAQLSVSLRLQREDDGGLPALLVRGDITAFCNRLAYPTQQGTISAYRRIVFCRDVRLLLSRMRAMGLTRQGEPIAGIPDEFTMGPEDIPDEPDDAEAGKDLPTEVMRHLCAHLQVLETIGCAEIRVAVELLIDTGRRPDEICQLTLDCLERDTDGKPVLIYDNIKAHRHGRRLPIPEATAAAIVAQQQLVRQRFPHESGNYLKLLPTPARNPHGRRSITDNSVTSRHRKWVNALPDILVPIAVEVDGKTTTLLRNRERLLAADDWAKSEAMPSDEEITRIRRLISRMKADLDDLSDEERTQIAEAVTVVRRTRSRVVGLGMPRIRQSLPDLRPDRSA